MKHSLYFEALRPYLEKRDRLNHLTGIIYYDLATNAGKKTIEDESGLLNFYQSQIAGIYSEVAFKNLVKKGLDDENASDAEHRLFETLYDQISLMEHISLSDYSKAMAAFSKSNEMWREFRPKNDFASWLPYWKECVKWARVLAKARMNNGEKTPYDALLNSYEPGETTEWLESIFNPLKKTIISLIPGVISRQSQRPLPSIKPYSYGAQCRLSYALLDYIRYDMEGGCLRTSAHPFSTDIHRYDARLTTKYVANDFRSNLFTILHEGGHCLEFQNKGFDQYENFIQNVSTAAQCETHSRFYENFIGRSEEIVPTLKKMVAENLDPGINFMSDEDFYALINQVNPGLIRCDADELSYCLHIIIRFEIERDLVNGVIECEDVPSIWNAKYKNYLGVNVTSDKDGCMQDVHWTDAEFGYFPSYALGNIYGAMIRERMNDEIRFGDLIREGKMDAILNWLRDNDFASDWMNPSDWIMEVTGQSITSAPYISYLKNKFGAE